MKWTDKAWESIQPLLDTIFHMPFIQELQSGTLPLAKFQFYMQQDAKYLEHFGRVLAVLGSKSPDNVQALDFFDFGKNALVVEKLLHETYFTQFGMASDQEIVMGPICHHYVHYLKSVAAFEPLEVAVAAVLPCFWIYKVVGDTIFANQSTSQNPYEAWIATYSGTDFADGVTLAKHYVDTMAEQTTEAMQTRMFEAFLSASRLEYMFWEAAYLQKGW
ncbi:thiaminase II [Sphingobacterium paludis]|uniref:Aminopyrimidine aminohydrolase n=1 Tax=Sphingobacterium paludis TaxID=1476465 RepID=A0A4V3E164_9SPHI|nr:thiaminase II [Sphingobacterium paludis]TDS11788.1 thiaminase/transcriptional activator TenA [Sphingobacterium paludis]